MKKLLIVMFNILLLVLSGLLFSAFLNKEGISSYFKYFDFDSFLVDDLLPSLFLVLFLYVIYFILSLSLPRKINIRTKAITTGILGSFIIYICMRFFVGFTFAGLNTATVLSLLSVLLIGVLLPFTEQWIKRLFR